MRVFDATQYFTRRQSDLRYVKVSDLTTAAIVSRLPPGSLPGSSIEDRTLTGQQIADRAIGLEQMLSTVRPPAIVPAKPNLPDPQYPVGSQIYLTTDKKLYINRSGADWELTARFGDISGTITPDQFESSIKPIFPVNSLPTLNIDPVTHLPTNYNVGDLVILTETSKLYALIDTGAYNYVWDPVVKAANLSQADYDAIFAGVVSTGYFKTAVGAANIFTVDDLGARNATIDNLLAPKIQATLANFTTLNGDTANLAYVTAGVIAAGAVTTDKLIVGSFDNLMEDGGCENPAASGCWIPDANGLQVAVSANAHTGSQCLVKTSASDSISRNRMVFAVKGADLTNPDTLYFEGWAKALAGTNGTAYIQILFYKDRGCTQYVSSYSIGWTAAAAAAWNYQNGSTAAPATARWARVVAYVAGQTTGTWLIDDLYVRTMIGQAYINSLQADIITGGILDFTSINARHLKADAIDAGTLTVGGSAVTPTGIVAQDSTNAQILQMGKIDSTHYGIWAKNAWFGGTGPSDAKIKCNADGTVTIDGSVTVGYAASAGSASSVPASGVGGGALNSGTTIAGNQITTGYISADRIAAGTLTVSGSATGINVYNGGASSYVWAGSLGCNEGMSGNSTLTHSGLSFVDGNSNMILSIGTSIGTSAPPGALNAYIQCLARVGATLKAVNIPLYF